MGTMKHRIIAIVGSASANSSNHILVQYLASLTNTECSWEILPPLANLPHFNPELSVENTPQHILDLRTRIEEAHGVLICTPEYVFSIPSGLKNLIEWCVSTVIFNKKPVGLITASASGEKGHEELQLIMRTVGAVFTEETMLLVQGVKGKIAPNGVITDAETKERVEIFAKNFVKFIQQSHNS